ncbi:MAG: hypothetical protein ACO39C_05680, partial [Chthoniobacterales bacterium]
MTHRFLTLIGCLLLSAPAGLASDAASLRALGGAFAGVYEKVVPSVVVLEVSREDDGEVDAFAWQFLFRDEDTPR